MRNIVFPGRVCYNVFIKPVCKQKSFCRNPLKSNRERNPMVKHIIIWKLKEEYSAEEKEAIKQGIKEGLEGLKGRIPGLCSIEVITEGLASSNGDLMLDSAFADEAALKGYSVHPEHVAVANGKVRPFTAQRSCFDFEV